MKILAMAYNFASHAAEMGRPSADPVPFVMPDTALLNGNKPFFIPNYTTRVDYGIEPVIHVNRMGRNIQERFADRYFDAIGIGVDFTARDLQQQASREGLPWSVAKGFDGSAAVSRMIPLAEIADLNNAEIRLMRNGQTVQQAGIGDMTENLCQIVAHVSRYFTLHTGDLIFCGPPSGTGPVEQNDRLDGFLNDRHLMSFSIK